MKTGLAAFWIYAIVCGFAAIVVVSSARFESADKDISTENDESIHDDYDSESTDFTTETKFKPTSAKINLGRKTSQVWQNSTAQVHLETHQKKNLRKKSKGGQHIARSADSAESTQNNGRKRTKTRRRSRKPSQDQNSAITSITASATIIENPDTAVEDSNSAESRKTQKRKNRNRKFRKYSRVEDSSVSSFAVNSNEGDAAVDQPPSSTSSESFETNSVGRENFPNLLNGKTTTSADDGESENPEGGAGMQMRRKTKNPRRNGNGKRRNGEQNRSKQKQRKMRLEAREQKRKLLQAKREMREKRKLEKLQRKKLKHQQNSDGDSDNANIPASLVEPAQIIAGKTTNSKNVRKTDTVGTSYQNRNFMAPPSIDYFVEKSFNYVDETNETLPLGAIGVSVETPGNGAILENSDGVAIISENIEVHQSPMEETSIENSVPLSGTSNSRVGGARRSSSESIEGDEEEFGIDSDASIDYEGGDLSCLKDGFTPAPEVRHADIKYLRNDLQGVENAFLEVEYICHRGYKLHFNGAIGTNISNVYCKNGQWLGVRPTCVRQKDFMMKTNETCKNSKRCEHLCYIGHDRREKCACHKGFRMRNNRCVDINECAENSSVCEFGCINTVGSYRCKCPKGLRAGDANSCIDINECLLRNGHGPCQDSCKNTWGSYKCSCDSLPGSQLSTDGHSCEDLDECSVNNGGCSHTCINTMGQAFCLCPDGWVLDKDWKTCIDVDECAERKFDVNEHRCEFGCVNTPGSYNCLVDIGADQPIEDNHLDCPDGYYKNSITDDCQDVNECSEDNGGCYHHCVNTIGSFHCTCRAGYIFAPDKYTCVETNSSTDVSCPPLFPPKHGYLECSRPIASDIDSTGNGGRRRITNRPGSQCVLRCPTGFRINGKFSKQCSASGTWIGDGDGTCIRYPKPKLICPSDIVVETPPNETMAKLTIPRPKTDVNYDRDVTITPVWVPHNSEVALEVGVKNITYTALHPVSKLSVSCSFTISVLAGQPPLVKFCPQTKKYSISKQHDSIKISWNEPVFVDNVNVTEISRTNSPGNSFGMGSHQIIYIARDLAGYEARCVFKLLVNVPFRKTISHPLPIYHMFYK